MEDLKKRITDWIEKKEYYKNLDYAKKRANSIRKKEDELETIKTKMSETIY